MALKEKLTSVSDRIKALQAEELRLVQARKEEIASLLEKIPGLLELDDMTIAGILADGVNLITTGSTKTEYYEEQAIKLPSFKRRKTNSSKTQKDSAIYESTPEATTA